MKKYITQSGDTWDSIAFNQLGSSKYTDILINANRKYIWTVIFLAGIELDIPDVETSLNSEKLPPWRVKNE